MEEFNTFAGQTQDFSQKDFVQSNISGFFEPKTNMWLGRLRFLLPFGYYDQNGLILSDDHDAKLHLPFKTAILLTVVASGGGLLFGYDIGVVSGALNQLAETFRLSCQLQALVVSSVLFGALFGSFIGGYFIDKYGRKSSIIFSSVLYCIGGIVLSAAQAYRDIIIGRIFLGIAMALAAASECVYVSELAPTRVRGRLVSLNELGITVGILFSYLINVAFAGDTLNGWRYMFGFSTLFSLLVLVCVIFLPKSPRFLLMNGKNNQAQSALYKVRLCASENEKQLILQEYQVMQTNAPNLGKKNSICSSLWNKSMLYPLTIASGLVILQQSTGEPNVLFYAQTILSAVGFHNEASATIGTVGLGVAKVVATIYGVMAVDKVGRRKLLLTGCALMLVAISSVSIIAFQFEIEGKQICTDNDTLQRNTGGNLTVTASSSVITIANDSALKWVALMLLILFVAAYSISFGPVTWIVLSEIFPRELRGRLFSFATSLNWAINLLISSTFLSFAQASGGLGWPFMLSAIFCSFSVVFVYFVVPETKDKSLEEITAVLNCNLRVKCHCRYCINLFSKADDTTQLIVDDV